MQITDHQIFISILRLFLKKFLKTKIESGILKMKQFLDATRIELTTLKFKEKLNKNENFSFFLILGFQILKLKKINFWF